MDKPKRFRKIPKAVEAVRIIDYYSMKQAVEWVKREGGIALIKFGKQNGDERLFVDTTSGLIEIPRQYYLIRGDLGGFYTYPADIFLQEYEEIHESATL